MRNQNGRASHETDHCKSVQMNSSLITNLLSPTGVQISKLYAIQEMFDSADNILQIVRRRILSFRIVGILILSIYRTIRSVYGKYVHL